MNWTDCEQQLKKITSEALKDSRLPVDSDDLDSIGLFDRIASFIDDNFGLEPDTKE